MSAEERESAELCECLYEDVKAVVHHQGEGDPDHQAKAVTDCTYQCRKRFMGRLFPDYEANYSGVCTKLSSPDVTQRFWELYWCDSAKCGVWIDPKGGLEQDRRLLSRPPSPMGPGKG